MAERCSISKIYDKRVHVTEHARITNRQTKNRNILQQWWNMLKNKKIPVLFERRKLGMVISNPHNKNE